MVADEYYDAVLSDAHCKFVEEIQKNIMDKETARRNPSPTQLKISIYPDVAITGEGEG